MERAAQARERALEAKLVAQQQLQQGLGLVGRVQQQGVIDCSAVVRCEGAELDGLEGEAGVAGGVGGQVQRQRVDAQHVGGRQRVSKPHRQSVQSPAHKPAGPQSSWMIRMR